jgi:hypothetical protein
MQITLSVKTEALFSSEAVVPKYNTIYNSEEHDINTNHHENLKRKMAINDIKFLSRVRVHNTLHNRRRCNLIFKGSRISMRRKSPLTTEATCLTVTFEPSCSVIKLKRKFEVLTMITVQIPALWNVKSCSLWTRTSEKSLRCTCQNKRDRIKRREESSRLKLSGEHNWVK